MIFHFLFFLFTTLFIIHSLSVVREHTNRRGDPRTISRLHERSMSELLFYGL